MAEMVLKLKLEGIGGVQTSLNSLNNSISVFDKALSKLDTTLNRLNRSLFFLAEQMHKISKIQLARVHSYPSRRASPSKDKPKKTAVSTISELLNVMETEDMDAKSADPGTASAAATIQTRSSKSFLSTMSPHLISVSTAVMQGSWKMAFSRLIAAFRDLSTMLGKGGPLGIALTILVGAVAALGVSGFALRNKLQEWVSLNNKFAPSPSMMGVGTALGNQGGLAQALWSTPGGPQFLRAQIDMIRNEKDPNAAYWLARALPNGQLLWETRYWSDEMLERALNMGMNPKSAQDATNALAEFNIVLEEFKQILIPLVTFLMKAFLILSPLVFMIRGINWLAGHENKRWGKNTPIEDMAKALDEQQKLQSEIADKQKESVEKFSQAVNDFVEGAQTINGGPRGSNAIPNSWLWGANQQLLAAHARNLGAFEI